MPSVITGLNAAIRTKTETVWQPRYGWTAQETWEGPRIQIQALYDSLALSGYRVRTTHVGPRFTLIVDLGTPPDEVPVERWKIDMERVQVSIWSAQIVNDALWTLAEGEDDAPAAIRKDIEDAVSKGKDCPAYIQGFGYAGRYPLYDVYIALLRGQTAYEIKRPILARQRTYSIAYTTRIVLDQVEKVYTTAALIAAFNLPAIIRAQLPVNPSISPPLGTAYGWKVNTASAEEIPAIYKVQESMDWIFDAWSTTWYQLIS